MRLSDKEGTPTTDKESSKREIVSALRERVLPKVEEARDVGFTFFACELDVSRPSMPIRLRFADGKGSYYDQSLRVFDVGRDHRVLLNVGDMVDIKIAVQAYVRGLDGVGMLDYGMSRTRVRARRAADAL